MNLYTLSAQYQQAFLSLADSDFDDETIDDTLQGLEGELVDKGRNVAAFFLNLDVEIAAIKQAEDKIASRRKLLENKRDRLKDYLREQMAACGITEIKALDSTFTAKLYLGRDESVQIDDEALIPTDYIKEKVTLSVDKTLIKKAIADGYAVPGASIIKKDRLTIS